MPKITFCFLSMQSSGSCGFQEQQRILGLFELSQEFKQQHYLAGLLLTELSAALDVESEAYEHTVFFKAYTTTTTTTISITTTLEL